jgi:hypothetical protein
MTKTWQFCKPALSRAFPGEKHEVARAFYVKYDQNYGLRARLPGVCFMVGSFRKCLFGILRNTEFYLEFTLFLVIPQIFCTVQYREIPRNSLQVMYTKFCIPSNKNSSIKNQRKVQKEWYMPRNSVKVCVYGIPYTFKCRLCRIVEKKIILKIEQTFFQLK